MRSGGAGITTCVMILFLDVDGVLNSSLGEYEFDECNMQNFGTLCKAIKPKVVLSSDWRRKTDALAWARAEIERFWPLFDFTPISKELFQRKEEITEWLSKNEWSSALILDDMSADYCDPKIKGVHFFRTNHRLGLTEIDVDNIKRLLSLNSTKD